MTSRPEASGDGPAVVMQSSASCNKIPLATGSTVENTCSVQKVTCLEIFLETRKVVRILNAPEKVAISVL